MNPDASVPAPAPTPTLLVVADTYFVDEMSAAVSSLPGWSIVGDDDSAVADLLLTNQPRTWFLLAPCGGPALSALAVVPSAVLFHGRPLVPEPDPGVPVDYLIGSWSHAELRFRLELLAERVRRERGTTVFRFDRSAVWSDFRSSSLSLDEYRILSALSRSRGAPVSRAALAAELAPRLPGQRASRALDMRISRLRSKLRHVTGMATPLIEATVGEGYRLTV